MDQKYESQSMINVVMYLFQENNHCIALNAIFFMFCKILTYTNKFLNTYLKKILN